jgi:hypothetical protein
MRRRQITIEGGRYLIFYSFEDEPGLDAASSSVAHSTRDDERDDERNANGDAGDSQSTHEPARASAVVLSAEDEPRV